MARQHAGTAVISEGHKEVVNIRSYEQQVKRQNAQPAMLFVFLFGRIVHRTIRIRPNSLKPLFGTPLILLPLTYSGVIVQYVGHWTCDHE